MTEAQQQTPYSVMGGEKSIQILVDRFYFYMDTLVETKELRAIHATDLNETNAKLFKFLSGWLGGPDLFQQTYGHPRLRQRHFSFAVTQQARDQWTFCMHKALYDISMPDELRNNIKQALDDLATHMINSHE